MEVKGAGLTTLLTLSINCSSGSKVIKKLKGRMQMYDEIFVICRYVKKKLK
jgi:hypothetical protein